MKSFFHILWFFVVLAFAIATNVNIAAQTLPSASLNIKTAPETILWVDNLRYGAVPAEGEMTIKNLRAGNHTIRARLKGRREISQTVHLAANDRQILQLALSAPADPAELSFQNAEELRGRGKHTEAIKEYRNALRLRPRGFTQARLGLARSLQVVDEYDDAYAQMRLALREKPGPFPEVHTILGNLKRAQGFSDDAIKSYQTAVVQGGTPEAYMGLALLAQDRNRPEDAIKYFRLALASANDTEPAIYFLLGNALEKEYRNKEAVEVYEKYLQLDPKGSQAASVRSVVRQLKREIR